MTTNASLVAKYMFFTKGVGVHDDKLMAFEFALRDAGISQFNWVTVSSILPPKCRIIEKELGLQMLYPGQVVFAVMARQEAYGRQAESEYEFEWPYATVGMARPTDFTQYGYMTEYHGMSRREGIGNRGSYAQDRAMDMLATMNNVKRSDMEGHYVHNYWQPVRDKWVSVISVGVLVL